MKPALFAILLFVPMLVVAQANAGGADLRNSGLDYVRACGLGTQSQPNQHAAVCNVWLTGVMDGLQAYNSNMKVLPLFDAPNATVGQVAKLVVKYVADHPGQANLPAAAVVLGTLIENFPRKDAAPTK
jgi:hypothetical protein